MVFGVQMLIFNQDLKKIIKVWLSKNAFRVDQNDKDCLSIAII